jgi:hypothetical protein
MTNLASLASTLLAHFRTVVITAQKDDPNPTGDWRGAVKARRAEKRAIHAFRDHVRSELVRHGHHRFLQHLEPDPEDGWRLHVFVADDLALALLDQITGGQCAIGDPASFAPEDFVREQLSDWIERGIVQPD